jgi:23S rRNA (uracil1939-C5)-methyltransferase
MNIVEGTELTVKIDDVAFGGKGVTRIENVVCFVPFTLPGEDVKICITSVKKNFLEAEVIEIIKASEERVEPVCEHFKDCGGCQYQHVSYSKQLDLKKSQLAQVLKRIGSFEEIPEISEVLASEKEYNYRNRITLNPRKLEDGKLLYGYKDLKNKRLIQIESCPLANEEVNKLIPQLTRTRWGRKNLDRDKPKSATLRDSAEDEPIIYYGSAPKGMPWRKEVLGEKQFRVPLGSFYQVNPEVAEGLFNKVNEWAGEISVPRVVDAFCGAGFLSVGLKDKHVIGIECDEASVNAAKYNAQQWETKSFNYIAGDANSLLNKHLKNKGAQTLLIMDPPRKGCGEQSLKAIENNKPAWILYVSCDPATLARDLKSICASGDYSLEKLALLDMFPQTSHFETMVLLKGKANA